MVQTNLDWRFTGRRQLGPSTIPKMVRSRVLAITLGVVTMAGVAGCSDDADGGGGSGLMAALGKVKATDSTRGYVEYGNLDATRSLHEADKKRFVLLTGFGTGELRNYARVTASAEGLGFDPQAQRTAIAAGSPPEWAAIIWGDYDVNAVNGRFAELGIERSANGDTTTWTSSADGDIDLRDPLVQIAGPGTLNNVRTAPGSFAFAPKSQTLSWVTDPGGDTLAGDQTMKSLANCLGDVVAAVINRSRDSDATIAVGVRAPSTTDVTEVICVAPGTRDPASIRDHITSELADGRAPATGGPWSDLLPNAKAELAGLPSAVRVTATPEADKPAGRVFQLMVNRSLDGLIGR
jgi:hypothetical protein